MNDAEPWPSGFVVGGEKIANYLLNPEHRRGQSKARFFLACGFEPAHPEVMATALLGHATRAAFAGRVRGYAGSTKLLFEGPMGTPAGPRRVRTVWQYGDEGTEAALVTAYPL